MVENMDSSLERGEPGSIKFRPFVRQSYVYDRAVFEKRIEQEVHISIWKC